MRFRERCSRTSVRPLPHSNASGADETTTKTRELRRRSHTSVMSDGRERRRARAIPCRRFCLCREWTFLWWRCFRSENSRSWNSRSCLSLAFRGGGGRGSCGPVALRGAAARRLLGIVAHIPAGTLELDGGRREHLFQLASAMRADRQGRIGKLLDPLRQAMTLFALVFVKRQLEVPTICLRY